MADEGVVEDLRIPEHCPAYRSSGSYDGEAIEKFFERELSALGRRFDERNGNDTFMRVARLTETIYEEVRAR